MKDMVKFKQKLSSKLDNLHTEWTTKNLYDKALVAMGELELIKGEEEATTQQKEALSNYMVANGLDNETLIQTGCSDSYKGFAVKLYADLLGEYGSKSRTDKMLAFYIARSFVRMLELQRYIDMQLDRDTYNDISTRRLAVLDKAYDRASRQYEASLSALKNFNTPPMQIRVTAKTANIANQQVVAESKNEKA